MEDKDFDKVKALILPVNSEWKVFIQDRRGHKKPDWGYFGGGIEEGETPLEAVIRETKEELSIDITEDDLISLGISDVEWDDKKLRRYFFLYKTDQKEFDVKEGAGGYWFTAEEALSHLDGKDNLKEILERAKSLH